MEGGGGWDHLPPKTSLKFCLVGMIRVLGQIHDPVVVRVAVLVGVAHEHVVAPVVVAAHRLRQQLDVVLLHSVHLFTLNGQSYDMTNHAAFKRSFLVKGGFL